MAVAAMVAETTSVRPHGGPPHPSLERPSHFPPPPPHPMCCWPRAARHIGPPAPGRRAPRGRAAPRPTAPPVVAGAAAAETSDHRAVPTRAPPPQKRGLYSHERRPKKPSAPSAVVPVTVTTSTWAAAGPLPPPRPDLPARAGNRKGLSRTVSSPQRQPVPPVPRQRPPRSAAAAAAPPNAAAAQSRSAVRRRDRHADGTRRRPRVQRRDGRRRARPDASATRVPTLGRAAGAPDATAAVSR